MPHPVETYTTWRDIQARLGDSIRRDVSDDVSRGLERSAMKLRVNSYILDLIDWSNALDDPIRKQYLPVASEMAPDHPYARFDTTREQGQSPTTCVVHRYPTKALFLALDVCPVYCRFCTRSWATGEADPSDASVRFSRKLWGDGVAYIRATPAIDDVIISGGDAFELSGDRLYELGETLLEIPHVRRLRIATRGLSADPGRVFRDPAWRDAVLRLSDLARERVKEACLQVHFNHSREVTPLAQDAAALFHKNAVVLRNQTVLMRGVNDTAPDMIALIRALSGSGIQPYYVYLHDLVPGCEALRTSVAHACTLEKAVRGQVSGCDCPAFIVDLLRGGGKRDIHSFEAYDEAFGVAAYRSSIRRPGRVYYQVDPIDGLSEAMQAAWRDPRRRFARLRALRRSLA